MNSHRSRQRRRRIAHARGLFRAFVLWSAMYDPTASSPAVETKRARLVGETVIAAREAGYRGQRLTVWFRQKGFPV